VIDVKSASKRPSKTLGNNKRRYSAPALEKGLDILQLIAARPEPITIPAIAQTLQRSTGELFRMIQVLQYRGFIEQSPRGDGYQLTGKLFALGMDQPSVKGLIEVALPRMRLLAEETNQSCHLVMHSQGQIVVVARMESSGQMGFSVRVGHRRSLPETVSGCVLYAFQSDRTRERWEAWFESIGPQKLAAFKQRADRARATGWAKARSTYVSGVVDMSAPLLRGDGAAGALTIPYVQFTETKHTMAKCLTLLIAAAREISERLIVSDART
jgi:DNA-binding IclR family transcriptional regulator